MQLSAESRDILRQYKTLINGRRAAADLSPVTTAQVVDSMCEYMTCQCAVYLAGQFILQGGKGMPTE
ncbi:hypothetical protein [Enterobacter sp.]|uniref:hypothetical protein n=1 Tax=Enterobacter sp. TaxID=42895 RepID=UPI00296F29C7|nr:hypothetical protein [Enterobacter sp.]